MVKTYGYFLLFLLIGFSYLVSLGSAQLTFSRGWYKRSVSESSIPSNICRPSKISKLRTIIQVTGSNKGIGYAVVKGLAQNFDGIIYMTARNEQRGQEALRNIHRELGAKSSKVHFHLLDITSESSVNRFRDFLQKEHGGLEVLVNNASIAFGKDAPEPYPEIAKVTMETNYTGTKRISCALLPIMRKNGRVVNVASRAGLLSHLGPSWKARLAVPDLTLDQLDEIVADFVRSGGEGTGKNTGFLSYAYFFSKAAQIAMTKLQSRDINAHLGHLNILVNACCPGFVQTDMTSQRGNKTPAEGADTILYLALLPPGARGPNGKLVGERKEVDWLNASFF